MATVRHVTSRSGLRTFQAHGFLLDRMYHWYVGLPSVTHWEAGNRHSWLAGQTAHCYTRSWMYPRYCPQNLAHDPKPILTAAQTLPIPTAARAEGAWRFSTLTTYLAKSLKRKPSCFRIHSRGPSTPSCFQIPNQRQPSCPWVRVRGYCPFLSFWAHWTPLQPAFFFNFGPRGITPGRNGPPHSTTHRHQPTWNSQPPQQLFGVKSNLLVYIWPIKFAISPPCACLGSTGQKHSYGLMTLTYYPFTAVLLLIYASLFLSGIYYTLHVFWCAAARMSDLEFEHWTNIKFLVTLGKSWKEIREMLVQVYGDNAMKKTAVCMWVKRFSKGR